MKPQRLKESLNNRSFWDRDSRLPVTCKTPQFLRPRVWRFWGDFWIAKVDVTSGADLSGSVFPSSRQPETPVINHSQRLHIPHKYRTYDGGRSSSALPKSNRSSSYSIYQLAKKNEKK